MRARLEGILVEAHRVVEAIAAHYRLSPPPGMSGAAEIKIKDRVARGSEGEISIVYRYGPEMGALVTANHRAGPTWSCEVQLE